MKKRLFAVLLVMACMFSSVVFASETLVLPGERYEITLPKGMEKKGPVAGDPDALKALYVGDHLEIDIFAYGVTDQTVDGIVRNLTESGYTAEIREVNGIRMVCYRFTDTVDDTPCIGYGWEDDRQFLEICFWYGSEEAGMETLRVMESIKILESVQ